jgi:hypothetical protein
MERVINASSTDRIKKGTDRNAKFGVRPVPVFASPSSELQPADRIKKGTNRSAKYGARSVPKFISPQVRSVTLGSTKIVRIAGPRPAPGYRTKVRARSCRRAARPHKKGDGSERQVQQYSARPVPKFQSPSTELPPRRPTA